MAVSVKGKKPTPKAPKSNNFFDISGATTDSKPKAGNNGSPFDPGTGANPGTDPDKFNFWLPQTAPRAKSGPVPKGPSTADLAAQQQQGMSFADYLAEANALGLGGSGTDYTALKAQLQKNASEGDARIAAMYKAFGDSVAGDAAGIGGNYDNAGSAITKSAADAKASVNSGYDAARAAQTQQFATLGIPEAAAVLASQGGAAASDQAHANANIAQNNVASANQNTSHKTNALDYNTNIGNASTLASATDRAALQQALASKLAELEGAESQDAGNGAKSAFSAALQLKSMDDSAGSAQGKAQQQDFENQLAAAKLKLQQTKAQGSSKTLADALAQYNQLAGVAQQGGVGTDAASFKDFLTNLQLAGKI
jgi:hypothetical protein